MKIAIFEYFTELRRSLRWWMVILFLIITVILVMVERDTDGFTTRLYHFYFLYLVAYTCKPRIRKINYLLPGDPGTRARYLIAAAMIKTVLFTFWYGIIYSINIILGDFGIGYLIRNLFGRDLLLILIVSVYTSGAAYINLQTETANRGVKDKSDKFQRTRKEKLQLTVVILLACIATTNAAILSNYLKGFWFVASVVLSYLCVIPILFWCKASIENMNTCYENIRKPQKII